MEKYKYRLSEDGSCLVLKEGVKARLGMAVYTTTHVTYEAQQKMAMAR